MPNRLLVAAQEALEHAKQHGVKNARLPNRRQMRALRERLNLSQSEFAKEYGLSLYLVRKFERPRRKRT